MPAADDRKPSLPSGPDPPRTTPLGGRPRRFSSCPWFLARASATAGAAPWTGGGGGPGGGGVGNGGVGPWHGRGSWPGGCGRRVSRSRAGVLILAGTECDSGAGQSQQEHDSPPPTISPMCCHGPTLPARREDDGGTFVGGHR